jgi:hypothetical protein
MLTRQHRGRQRIKQPFPEATALEEHRRWGNKTTTKSDGTGLQHQAQNVRSGTPSNTGRARLPTRDDDTSAAGTTSYQASTSVNNRRVNIEVAESSIEILVENSLAAEQHDEVAKSVLLPSETACSLENGTATPEITNGVDFDFAASRHEHSKHTSHAPLANRCHHPSATSSTAPQTEIQLQHFNTDKSYTKAGTWPTGTAGQSVCLSGGLTLAQADDGDLFDLAARPPSRAKSEAQFRPQSRRSDRAKPANRPLSKHDLTPAVPVIPQSSHAAKVKKPSKSNTKNIVADRPRSSEQESLVGLQSLVQLHQQSTDGILESFRERDNVIKSKQAEIQEQGVRITSQKAEIEQQAARIQALELQVQALRKKMEDDKATLAPKYMKIMQQGQKYATHANEVVAAQKWLKDAAESIKKRTDETLKAYAASEKMTRELQSALKNSREIRLMAQNLETGK